MINKVDVAQCTLCKACSNICPKNAIQFTNRVLTFDYPVIDSKKCSRCDMCEKACPALGSPNAPTYEHKAYAVKNLDDNVRLYSSSGGVFSVLAEQVIASGDLVCGAVFDDKFHARHILTNQRNEFKKMIGSKYVQSDLLLCYRQIKEALAKGMKVLFSGCPCQVAGLKSYLQNESKNLYTIDLICHGVPGPELFDTYLSILEKKYNSKIIDFRFRDKYLGWHNSSVRIAFRNGKVYTKPIIADAYVKGYFNRITFKSACYQCAFKNFASNSDITLGDFWGAEEVLPDFDDNKGLSAVIVNSPRGEELLMAIQDHVNLRPVPLESVIKYNQNLIKPSEKKPMRDTFFSLVEQKGLEKAFEAMLWEKPKDLIKRKLRYAFRCVKHSLKGKDKPLY